MRPELFLIPGTAIPISSYGAMTAISFLGGTWLMMRNARRLKADPDIVLNLAFIALIFSVIGAHTFYVIHYWDEQYAHRPLAALNPLSGGFEFYGGFIGAFVPSFIYVWMKRLSIRIYADLVAPSLLLGMGIGRIGCFLQGCCWGGACPDALPWAVQFPASSLPYQAQWDDRLVTLPEELILTDSTGTVYSEATRYAGPLPPHIIHLTPPREEFLRGSLQRTRAKWEKARAAGDPGKIAKTRRDYQHTQAMIDHLERYGGKPEVFAGLVERFDYRSLPLHPAQLYSAIGPLLLAVLAQCYLFRRPRHGTVLVVGYMLYAVERFVEEMIRTDNPQDTFGLTVSQGISIAIFCITVAVYFLLKLLPLRSAAPTCPPPKKAKGQEAAVPA